MQELILQELQKANSRLDEFGINLQSIESRLSSVEECHKSTFLLLVMRKLAGKVAGKVNKLFPQYWYANQYLDE